MHSHSWEANRFSASQEIPRILWSPNGSLSHSQSPPPVPVLSQSISPGPWLSMWTFRNMLRFYCEELLAPRPTPKLEDHPLSAVRDCLFNIFRSSIRNLKMRHAVVKGTH